MRHLRLPERAPLRLPEDERPFPNNPRRDGPSSLSASTRLKLKTVAEITGHLFPSAFVGKGFRLGAVAGAGEMTSAD